MKANFKDIEISLRINNNVGYPVPISILGNQYNLRDTVNNKTEYRWDLTGFSFTVETVISLQWKANSSASFTLYTAVLPTQSLQAVVNAINQLGIGFFSLYTSGGSTYISTYNDNYTFGNLDIIAAAPVINYSIDTPISLGNINIDVNGTPVVAVANPATQSGQINITAGDSIHFHGNSDYSEVRDNGTVVFSGTSAFTYTFVAADGHIYTLTAYDTP